MLEQKIEDIYCRRVVGVPRNTPVAEAILSMRDNAISCIAVLDEGRPVGIFTERDIVRCISDKGINFEGLPMEEVMSKGLVTVEPEDTVFDAFEILADRSIRHLIVVDGAGRAVGMVTQSDMISHLGYDYFIKVRTISQIMNRSIISVPPGMTVLGASRRMSEMSVSFLIVKAGDLPRGILTERDIARIVTEDRDLRTTRVEEVMNRPIITVPEQTPISEAVGLMKERKIRRLVVVDDAGRAVGITTQTDMVRGLESKYIDALKQIIVDQGSALNRVIRELSDKTLYLDNILSSSINMGIVTMDSDYRVVYYNTAAEAILGVPGPEVVGGDVRKIHRCFNVSPRRLNKALEVAALKKAYDFEFSRETDKGRRCVEGRVSAIWKKKSLIGYVFILQDVTDQRRAEETIRYLAYYDVLTRLPNRALFNERLAMDIQRCRRKRMSLALMLMDMDRFKEINDTFGHQAGDELLRSVAGRLKDRFRDTDTVARVGGDEFTFIFPEIHGREDAGDIAGKILEYLADPFRIASRSFRMAFSLGVSLFPEHGEDAEVLYMHADRAMYRAKEIGRANRRSNFQMA